MKSGRVRYLLVFFAAVLLANQAVASARACMVQLSAQDRAEIQVLVSSGEEHSCLEAGIEAICLAHCTQIYRSDDQRLFSDSPAVAVAPPLILNRGGFIPATGWHVTASAPPAGGPSLTILFRNLRI